MKKIFSLVFQIYLFLFLAAPIAEACRGGENTPPESIEKAYKNAAIVFIGTVISVDPPKKGKDVVSTFEVSRSWKGMKSGTLSFPVETGRSCDLGKDIEVGSRWFVLVSKAGERIVTASHSRRLFVLKEEEKLIEEVEKIK